MIAKTIEQMLDELSLVGRPRLARTKSGCWCAHLEFPAPEGVTAEVRSDFNHKTYREALEVLIGRLGDLRSTVSPHREALP